AIGRPILGSPASVNGFDRDAVAGYLGRAYAAPRIVVAASGAVEPDALFEEASRRFGGFGAGAPGAEEPAARYVGGEKRVKRRTEQSQIVIGFPGRGAREDGNYAAHAFATAAGGGMSSRLFQEVREKRGLAYSVQAFHWTFADAGLFGFSAGAAPGDVAELARAALDTLAETARGLDEAELSRAKAQMKVALLAATESSPARADLASRQLLVHGRAIPPAEVAARIDALGVEDVRAVGAGMLSGPPSVALVGPKGDWLDAAAVAARLAGGVS
ncbi:MAG: insulinase family protein, partial [Hyphomicrobiales bacterium]|nr:insulinase family protein [Hyphomicrobiales bacterium]